MRIQGNENAGRSSIWFLLIYLLADIFSSYAQSQMTANESPVVLEEVGIDQRLDEQLPLDLVFQNETGKSVALAEYFGEKPAILSLVYYECPMLCTLVLNGLLRSLRTLSFDAGNQFSIVTLSIDPKETSELASQKKVEYISQYKREGAEKGWHFLTGEEEAVKTLADTIGFRYAYQPETGQYAHASGIMVVTPQGNVARYFYGVEYATRDLRLALVEAADGKIGSPVDQLLLYCYHYDPTTGKYGLLIMHVIRLAGVATVFALGGFIIAMLLRDRR